MLDENARKPLWELGFLMGIVQTPDYPGADQGSIRYLPLPYFRYRGEILRSDEEGGTRARLFRSTELDFDVSAAAAFPVGRGDNDARRGMPELDWIGELGPRLIVEFANIPQLSLYLPLRAVFTTDISYFEYLGMKFSPAIGWSDQLWEEYRLGYVARLTSDFATSGVVDRFYEVTPEFVTADRPEFDAHGGYMSSSLTLGVFRRGRSVEWFTGAQYERLDGARNRKSPLMRTNENVSIFFGLAFLLYESDREGYR